MRFAAAALSLSLFFLTACGYVGPVLPPSPEIPNAISNLTASERGDQLLLHFATPARTTDSLAIREFAAIDLRIGPNVVPFDFDRWAAVAKSYEVELPPPSDRDDPQPKLISVSVPVSDWEGQHIAIAVRASVRSRDHFSAWSNRVVMDVVPPLQPPVIHLESTAKGVAVSWHSDPNTEYEVFRQAPSDKAPADLGSTADSFFVDSAAQYDIEYRYFVVAKFGGSESLPSKPKLITAVDKFPPAVPASITALAGPATVEVSWQRSPDADLQGYFVYRSTNNGAAERQGALVKVPAYTDKQVEHGKTYSYQVSAVDKKGNESDKSRPAEVAF